MKGLCVLCEKNQELRNSHLIPAFVYDWLRETSATGFMRGAIDANKRVQDGRKKRLFCGECEQRLGIDESKFASNIFHPFVTEELDEWGRQTNTIESFDYEEWLLRFIISLQYRHILCVGEDVKRGVGSGKYQDLMDLIPIWRDYLRGDRSDTGDNRSYVIFLQNLAFGSGTVPKDIDDKVNSYLLRSVDATVASGKKDLGVYTKIGPIVIFTTIYPSELKKMNAIVVRKKGRIPTAQILRNSRLNRFIFISRPKEAMSLVKISEKQQERIEETVAKDLRRAANSIGAKAYMSDQFLSRLPVDDGKG